MLLLLVLLLLLPSWYRLILIGVERHPDLPEVFLLRPKHFVLWMHCYALFGGGQMAGFLNGLFPVVEEVDAADSASLGPPKSSSTE